MLKKDPNKDEIKMLVSMFQFFLKANCDENELNVFTIEFLMRLPAIFLSWK